MAEGLHKRSLESSTAAGLAALLTLLGACSVTNAAGVTGRQSVSQETLAGADLEDSFKYWNASNAMDKAHFGFFGPPSGNWSTCVFDEVNSAYPADFSEKDGILTVKLDDHHGGLVLLLADGGEDEQGRIMPPQPTDDITETFMEDKGCDLNPYEDPGPIHPSE